MVALQPVDYTVGCAVLHPPARAPVAAILDQMHLSEAVRDVRLRSAGPYGPYLMLALQVGKGAVRRAAELALGQGIGPAALGETGDAAFPWEQEARHHSMGDQVRIPGPP